MNGIGLAAQIALSGMAIPAPDRAPLPARHGGMEMKVTCDFPEFSELELRIVRRIAGQMVRSRCFTSNDREDLEQELLVHLWNRRDEYTPDHASQCGYETYIRKILNKKRTDLIRNKLFQLRQAGYEPADSDDDSSVSQRNLSPRAASFLPRREFNVEENVVLKEEIQRILCRLGKRKRQICVLLSEGHRPLDIAKELNISPTTVYTHIEQLREIFENEGLNANFN